MEPGVGGREKKFSSTTLILEKNLIAYGLGTRVEDLVDREIDNFDAPVAQPSRFFPHALFYFSLIILGVLLLTHYLILAEHNSEMRDHFPKR